MTPSAPAADPRTVEAYARELVAKGGSARVLALAADPSYHGPREVAVDDTVVQVRGCVSALAVRDLLVDLPEDGYAIVLTDRPLEDLGDSLIARFRRQRIEPMDAWTTAPALFRAGSVDGGLRHALPWLPAVLMANLPPEGYPPSPTDEVSRDHLLGSLVGEVLQLPAHEVALGPLLRQLSDPTVRQRWTDLPEGARVGVALWVAERAGSAARAALTLAAAHRTSGTHILALGLMLDVLYRSDASPEAALARHGWEKGHDLPRVAVEDAVALGSASRTRVQLLLGQDPAALQVVWREVPVAMRIATYPGGEAESLSHPDGYRARLVGLAVVLRAVRLSEDGVVSAEHAVAALEAHDLAWTEQRAETERTQMAVRLLRWLARPEADAPRTLAAAMGRQLNDDGWVDRALADVVSGSRVPELVGEYQALCRTVQDRRDEHDRQFSVLLAEATARDVLQPGLLPVERVLEDVVAPLTRTIPVLLIVVDGMSAAVAVALGEEIAIRGWAEHVPADAAQGRAPVLAALPTLTRYSRTSLFSGRLREGTQVDEKRELAGLLGATVLHKDDLRSPAGAAVNPTVADRIASGDRLVAAVLNSVDDTLAKHDPDGTRWSLATIQHLDALLELANRNGRAVVLISDHGHVVERGGRHEPRPESEARWRTVVGEPPGPGEVALAGPRILAGGGRIIAAWDEGLRYGPKAAGYHGGASAAEVTIPLLVFTPSEMDLTAARWVPAGDPVPLWWDEASEAPASVAAPGPTPPAAPRRARPTRRDESEPSDVLFDVPLTGPQKSAEMSAPTDRWGRDLDAFEQSPVAVRMRQRAGRSAQSEAVMRQLLGVLLDGDGRASAEQAARALGLASPARLRLALPGVRNLLNAEGYQVITLDADGRTVLLDVALWRQQFGLR